jgi:ABC-2 type transport system permease protein
VWAIFAKDLREVVRNKNTVSVLISGLFIVVFYRYLPSITASIDPPRLWVYDQGNSSLGAFLENSTVVDAWAGAESWTKVEELLREADRPELGLVIPADFDRILEAGGEVTLQGTIMHWVSAQDAAELKQIAEDEIARLLGRRVPISTEGNLLYLLPESTGPGVQASLAALILLAMVGVSLVPHLMMGEKQARTLDVLLASPASEVHVVVAKALTGLVYCLVGGAIALAVNYSIVMHWWLAILGVVCFSLFSIGLGLALGTKIETRAQLSLWSWVIFMPMFIPAIAVLLEGLVPDGVIQVVRFTPTVAFSTVWRYAFARSMSPAEPLALSAYVLLWAVGALGVAVWLMRRRDRQAERGATVRRVAPASPQAGVLKALTPRGARAIQEISVQEEGGAIQSQGLAKLRRLESVVASPRSGVRILWAVFAKDMREALTNKLLLSILVGTMILLLNGAVLPLLVEIRWRPAAIVYDEGRSTLIRALMGRDDFGIRLAESRQEFEDIITSGPGTWLGLVIPPDFDQRAGDPAGIMLEGYAAHWANEDKLTQSTAVFEEELGLATWSEVRINLLGHTLYPATDAGGQIALNLTTVVIAMTVIGAALVPLLMVEEKESHTLDVLLISPARFVEVMIGKAMVGGVYCLLAACVAILFNRQWIVHWDIVLLAAILSAAFTVALGMLVGVLADNPTSAALWVGPILLIVLGPAIAQFFASPTWPTIVHDVLPWMPGSLMLNLYRLSVAGEVPGSLLLANAAALAGMAGAVYLLVGWRIRRLYR